MSTVQNQFRPSPLLLLPPLVLLVPPVPLLALVPPPPRQDPRYLHPNPARHLLHPQL